MHIHREMSHISIHLSKRRTHIPHLHISSFRDQIFFDSWRVYHRERCIFGRGAAGDRSSLQDLNHFLIDIHLQHPRSAGYVTPLFIFYFNFVHWFVNFWSIFRFIFCSLLKISLLIIKYTSEFSCPHTHVSTVIQIHQVTYMHIWS